MIIYFFKMHKHESILKNKIFKGQRRIKRQTKTHVLNKISLNKFTLL